MRDLRRLAQHRAHTAIFRLRKLYRAVNGIGVEMASGEDMLHRDLDEDLGMLLSAHPTSPHLIAGEVLPLLAENRDDIHPHAGEQAHERQLHRAEARILSAILRTSG